MATRPPTSRTRMTECVKSLQAESVLAGLAAMPALVDYRDERGRNWLHICAGVNATKRAGVKPSDAIALADGLLRLGVDINEPAFTEGSWQATALWYAVGRGRNLALARFLLEQGASPAHCLWAASFNEDLSMIRLLIEFGAPLDAIAEQETPFLGTIKASKFRGARVLLDAGSDPDFVDVRGMTALHYMLKKNSDAGHFSMFVDHGARGDIKGPDGRTAREILARKRDKAFHAIAKKLA
jgi:ankyrin repeat protein